MELYTLVYLSKSTIPLYRYQIHRLLAECRLFNLKNNVTGILLSLDGHFIQVLEGDEEIILSLYDKIKKDSRHTDIRIILEKPIKKRVFLDWSMGYKDISELELRNIPYLNLFLENKIVSDSVDIASDVYGLLVQFRDDPECFS